MPSTANFTHHYSTIFLFHLALCSDGNLPCKHDRVNPDHPSSDNCCQQCPWANACPRQPGPPNQNACSGLKSSDGEFHHRARGRRHPAEGDGLAEVPHSQKERTGRESWHLRKQRYFPCFHPEGLSRSLFPWSWEVCRGKTLSEENESERWRQPSFLPGAPWSFPPHKCSKIVVLSTPPPLKQRTEPTAPQPTSTQVLQFCPHNRVQALPPIAERDHNLKHSPAASATRKSQATDWVPAGGSHRGRGRLLC